MHNYIIFHFMQHVKINLLLFGKNNKHFGKRSRNWLVSSQHVNKIWQKKGQKKKKEKEKDHYSWY